MDPAPVLVVDDDPAFRALLALAVRNLGLEPIEAGSAKEGYRIARRRPLLAIVSDYSMPGPSGLELLQRIRGKGLEMPFVLASSLFPDDVPTAAMDAGADAVLDKTLLLDELPSILGRAARDAVAA